MTTTRDNPEMWRYDTFCNQAYDYEGERIIYSLRSGETHYLNFCATEILKLLSAKPTTIKSLEKGLKKSPYPAPLTEEIQNIINHLHEHGIVEQI
ncbi:hypothetical protein Thiowin_02766 [Thiorhodovibrio winogradskyi]|uniref:HPr-rel-A system PqqD family protein n=1 Tax=Thiorhodovibrio winogradskyi TaxID=77007 RepID=A0ABZ0SC97_9GAMM|nr:HPr-rel-A system PqqD family peptide chaperone [Thiorhodovibrio winogradskyi]